MGKKLVFRCAGCRGEVKDSKRLAESWAHASTSLGDAGWRVVHVVRGERRAWVLLCDECAPMVLEQVAQSAAAGAVTFRD